MRWNAPATLCAVAGLALLAACGNDTGDASPAIPESRADTVTDKVRASGPQRIYYSKDDRFEISYNAERLTEVQAHQAFPHNYDTRVSAVKFIPIERAEKLTSGNCMYGQSGRQSPCTAAQEPGVGVAIVNRDIEMLRAQITPELIRSAEIAGREGFRMTAQAEGAGTTYIYLPAGDTQTLIAYRGFSDIAGPDEATFDEMLQSLVIHTD